MQQNVEMYNDEVERRSSIAKMSGRKEMHDRKDHEFEESCLSPRNVVSSCECIPSHPQVSVFALNDVGGWRL